MSKDQCNHVMPSMAERTSDTGRAANGLPPFAGTAPIGIPSGNGGNTIVYGGGGGGRTMAMHETLSGATLSVKPTNPKDAIAGDKVPLWLLSPIAKAHWASAQFCGQVKYGAWNWRDAGARASIYLSAIERHADAYKSGESHDPVDGTHHLGNIMACCSILLEATAMGLLVDDRPPSFSIRTVYKDVQEQMKHMRVLYKDHPVPRHFTIEDTKDVNKSTT